HPVQQCLDGSGDDVAVLADTEHSLTLVNLEFCITPRCHIRARTYRVFMVINDLHGLAQMLADCMGSDINGSITSIGKRHSTMLVTDMDFDIHPLRILTDFTAVITERRINRKIFLLEQLHNIAAFDFFAGGVADLLYHAAEFNLQTARQLQARFLLQQERKSTRLNSSHVKISYAV